MSGALVVVGTPIGNLADLSPRAVAELDAADVVGCEDTRRTGRLLAHAGIERPRLIRIDEHTEHEASPEIVALVGAGRRVAIVTDAGMPGVSDPGQRVVAAVAEAGLAVVVVPGPSAVSAAVAVSGLPARRFAFEGFLPRRGAERSRRLAAVAADERATVIYESPHRLAATLVDLVSVCGGGRRAAVAREMTKLHEEVVRGTLDALVAWAEGPVKGEVVVVVEGAPVPAGAGDEEIVAALKGELAAGLSTRDAAAAVAARFSVGRRRVYELSLGLDRD